MAMTAIIPSIVNRVRRDEKRARRPGTGRVTTERKFTLAARAVSGLGRIGRRTGLPLKQGVKRDAYGLDDVSAFWRDSLESGAGAPLEEGDAQADSSVAPAPVQPTVAAADAREPEAAPAPEPAPAAPTTSEANPFRRANKLMRTPRPARSAPVEETDPTAIADQPAFAAEEEAAATAPQPVAATPAAPTPVAPAPAPAVESAGPSEAEAPPTADPFRRVNKLMRTPKPARHATPEDEADEQLPPPSGPVMDEAEATAQEAEPPASEEPTQPTQPTPVAPVAPVVQPLPAATPVERCSMGTSPIQSATEEAAVSTETEPVAAPPPAATRCVSMGTSPIPEPLLGLAGAPAAVHHAEAGTAAGAPEAEPQQDEQMDDGFGMGDSGFGDDPYDGAEDAAGTEPDAEEGSPIRQLRAADDDDDDDDDLEEQEQEQEEEVPPPPPPPPVQPTPAQPKRKAPARGGGGGGGGGKRSKKTSLENLGDTPFRQLVAEKAEAAEGEGVRRGKRNRVQPLEFWRNERPKYGRRDSARFECIVGYETMPREETPPHFRRMRQRNAAAAKANKGYKPDNEGVPADSPAAPTPVWRA